MRLSAAVTVLLLSATGCIKEISSEERLDQDTAHLSGKDRPLSAEALGKVSCEDARGTLDTARDVNRPETERVMSYIDLYSSLTKRTAMFEDAMTRNPDLSYTQGSEELVAAKDTCIQQTADVKVEFETYVRELVDVPTVQEVKGGNTITVPRLDFNTLRQAIQALDLEDKEQLMSRVLNAEKRVAAARPAEDDASPAPAPSGGRRRNR
jgi:hypothetical protein